MRDNDATQPLTPCALVRVPVQKWLERTPGLESDWFAKLEANVAKEGAQAKLDAEAIEDQTEREASLKSCADSEKMYKSFFNEEDHNNLLRKSQRSLSHRASKGALMIFLLRSADGVIMFACLRVRVSACLHVAACLLFQLTDRSIRGIYRLEAIV